MKHCRRRKCRCCQELFHPDPRNQYHQHYCTKPACRKASKAASQRRWLSKSQNQDYFCGPANVERVQAWRAAHPGYSRHSRKTLQDDCMAQPIDNKDKFSDLTYGRKIRLDLVTYGYYTIIFCAHRAAYGLTKYM